MSETPKKRGRPRQFDPAQALARATEAFLRQGYSGSSVDSLAQAMHVNKPSLYAAFGDKRALFLEVLSARFKRVGVRYHAAFESGGTLEDSLHRLFDEAVEICLGEGGPPGCPIASASATEALEDEVIGDAVRAFRARSDKALARWIHDKAPCSDAASVEGVARLASGVLYDIALRARVGESRAKLRSLAREAARVFALAVS